MPKPLPSYCSKVNVDKIIFSSVFIYNLLHRTGPKLTCFNLVIDWVYQPSAPTMKKKEDAVIYARTPTPPPNIATANVCHSGLVHISSGPTSESVNSVHGLLSENTTGNAGQTKINVDLNVSQNAANTYFDTNSRSPNVTRVSYQSALEIPAENTVSDTTRGLLANKVAQGRGESTFYTPDKSCYQRRAPFIKKQQFTISPVGQTITAHDQNGSDHSQKSFLSTPVKFSPAQSPRIVGIVAPLLGQQNVRFHAVRPSLANDLFPNLVQMSPVLLPGKHQLKYPDVPASYKLISDAPTPNFQETLKDKQQGKLKVKQRHYNN